MFNLVLASKSPRRKFFLEQWGFVFDTIPIEISEILDKNLSIECAVEDLAKRKAQALVQSGKLKGIGTYLILSADTIVYQNGQEIGKPKDQEDAFRTLQRLSGTHHQVITAYCLWPYNSSPIVGHSVSDVKFRSLSDQEIRDYIATGDPMDKAGSYGIQSLGRHFVESFTGTLENIAGLPIQQIDQVIKNNHWDLATKGKNVSKKS